MVNVSQGRADITLDGREIGFIEYSYSARQWWGYDASGKRISNWPNPHRRDAIRDVVKAARP